MRLFGWLLLLYSFSFFDVAAAPNLRFRHYTVENGLAVNAVCCFYQDSHGFIWVGTINGLNRFDGRTFKTFDLPKGKHSSFVGNIIFSIVEDQNKCLWVGTDLGLMILDLQTERLAPFEAKTPQGVQINSRVHSIIIDRNKDIWIATLGQGLFKFEAKKQILKQYRSSVRNGNSICSDKLRRLYEDRSGVIWIASFDNGLDCFDPRTEKFKHFLPYGKPVDMRDDNILEDSKGNFWICNFNNGLAKMDRKRGVFTHYLTPNSPDHILHIRSIVEYEPGTLLLASDDGLTFFYTETGKAKTIRMDKSSPNGLNDNYLQTLFVDREKGLWVGTYFGGINYSTPFLNNFSYFSNISSEHPFPGKVVSVLCEDKANNIWIGTDDAGLIFYDVKDNRFRQYLPQKGTNSLSYKNIHALLCDDDKLWIGTFSGGLDVLDLKTGRFKNYKASDSEKSLYYSSVYALYKDNQGTIWVGTPLGLNRYNPKEDNFDRIKELYLNGISSIIQDCKGYIWVGTGDKGLFRLDKRTNKWKNYSFKEAQKTSLQNNKVSTLCFDNDSQLWIGTDGGGLIKYHYVTDDFEVVLDKLPSNNIHKIIPEGKDLWISTNKGIVKFNTQTKRYRVYTQLDGLQGDQFSPNAGLKSKSGKIYFGGINGFNSFDPNKMVINRANPTVQLSDFYLFNKLVTPGDDKSPLKNSIGYEKEITLSHNQSMIGFEFVALSFIAPNKNRYAYKLEGFDKDWIEQTGEPKVTYTNLPPGRYTFRVKASNSDGVWSSNEVTLKVKVKPPFWRSNLAYILYVLLLVWITITVFRKSKEKIEKEHQNKIRQLQAEKDKELYHSKIEFFTNIVHEIRTPLTLIMGPVEYVLKSNKIVDEVREDLLVVKNNSSRLLYLVNQLMDFRKAEAGGMYLNFERVDVSMLVDGVVKQFEPSAKIKGIAIKPTYSDQVCIANVDSEAFTKAVVNIMSNALKFTRDTIAISVIPNQEQEVINIKITDNGLGIPLKEQAKVFKPFYQVKKAASNRSAGTGVGLALTKSLVELHHGELLLESYEGVETSFTIRIPLLADAEKEPIASGEGLSEIVESQEVVTSNSNLLGEPSINPSIPKVLVVDDNKEMLHFLMQQLGAKYIVVCASSGMEALKLLESNNFDLVISDVMMPEVDGYELCSRIKSNISTSHIPVLLLTAKCSVKDKIEGLEVGAEAYLEKPFSVEYLAAQIVSLLKNRKIVREKFANTPFVSPASIVSSKADENFINKLTEIIEKNISDADLSIEMLAHEMCLSRTSFFAKIKGVSGLTPNDYIRLIRLKKAAEYLSQGEYRINEVCFLVGFNSPSYFAKCFQKQFGVLPNDFRVAK